MAVSQPLARKFGLLAVPAVVLTAAAMLPRFPGISPAWQGQLQHLPYLLLAALLLLSFHFNRGRSFLVAFLLTAVYWALASFAPLGPAGFPERFVWELAAFLLPLDIVLIAFMRERGVVTSSGRLRISFLLGQAALGGWLVHYRYTGVEQLLATPFMKIPPLASSPVPQAVLVLYVAAVAILAARFLLRPNPLESGLCGVLVAMAVPLSHPAGGYLPLFTAAAAVILTVSVLQDSHNMAFRDDLTGLPSRRALNEQLQGLGRRYVIAMLDVDHFKRFNDTYGHDVGDQVLRMVAARLAAVKGGGRAFRYGGEEFTILFPRKHMKETIPHLEEVRRSVESYRLAIRSTGRPEDSAEGRKRRGAGGGEKSVSVTISIGIADCRDGENVPNDVVKAADKALYRAKEKGRNQLSR